MARKAVTLSIEEDVWSEFKKYSIDQKEDASDIIERFMQKAVKA